ncbi:surfeit locus protein 2 [Salminus brasiliensis]|uniref:surfeit locus protein 2 n=1 Tax=Salminus brasiliensis TaxID=930266 RepID=UPI003B831F5D
MEDLPAELRDFLQNQPFLQLTEDKKIKCSLNGHELPCNLTELRNFTSGIKFKKLCATAEFNYSQYEPHLVPSTKQPNHLFCKLTLRHINRVPEHVLRHVNGKRYKKALTYYEECMKKGEKFVPARLRATNRPKHTDDDMERDREKGHKQKQDSGIWAPTSSGEEGSDSEDSMSDLYPPSMFILKSPEEQEKMEADEDDFQTDEDEMEISDKDEKQVKQKRKKVQAANFNKKLKKNRKRRGFKPMGKVKK